MASSSSSRVHVQNSIALQAARDGDLRTLKEMAERTDLRGAKDVEGANALHLAADKGSLDCCKFLIEEVGLGVNTATTTGKTPLSCAIYAGNAQVMKYLIDHGANPKKATAQGLTMMHIAAGRGMIPVDIMLVDYVGTPLHAAASRGQHQAMKILLEHGADPNILMDENVSSLMLACCEKSLKCMRLLIEAGADVNCNSYRGPTPLAHALKAGWTDIVKFLLEAGADPNIPDMNRFALQAAYNGDLRTLKEMAKWTDLRGAKDVEGANALHLAADKGSLECCKFLIEEVGLGVNSVTTTGKTPLSGAVYVGHVQVMKYLLDGGANPRKANAQGVTMLHLAAGRGLCEPLELLLSQGMIPVDIMLGAYVGAPLHAAATMGQHQAMKILLEHGADPNIHMDDNVSPLMLACWEKSLKCMRLLIEAGADANGSSYHGPNPLTHAVEAGWTDIVKFLLEAGADPNIPAEGGDIPIKLAAMCGRRDLVKILFSKTIQVPSLPYWTVDGIIRTMESPLIRHQDPVPGNGKITALKSRGRDAFAKEDHHAALYFFGRVIEIDPSDATMFSNRSACWLRMREWERAFSDAQHCRKLQPDWCKGWFREGTALTFMENYQGAADAFREALKREPESDEIKSALGEAMESAARSGDKKH